MLNYCQQVHFPVNERAHLQFDCFTCTYQVICPDKYKIQQRKERAIDGKTDCLDGKRVQREPLHR